MYHRGCPRRRGPVQNPYGQDIRRMESLVLYLALSSILGRPQGIPAPLQLFNGLFYLLLHHNGTKHPQSNRTRCATRNATCFCCFISLGYVAHALALPHAVAAFLHMITIFQLSSRSMSVKGKPVLWHDLPGSQPYNPRVTLAKSLPLPKTDHTYVALLTLTAYSSNG